MIYQIHWIEHCSMINNCLIFYSLVPSNAPQESNPPQNWYQMASVQEPDIREPETTLHSTLPYQQLQSGHTNNSYYPMYSNTISQQYQIPNVRQYQTYQPTNYPYYWPGYWYPPTPDVQPTPESRPQPNSYLNVSPTKVRSISRYCFLTILYRINTIYDIYHPHKDLLHIDNHHNLNGLHFHAQIFSFLVMGRQIALSPKIP